MNYYIQRSKLKFEIRERGVEKFPFFRLLKIFLFDYFLKQNLLKRFSKFQANI